MSKVKRNLLIGMLFAVLFTLALPHEQTYAASSKTMIRAYHTYVAAHKKSIKNYKIVYIGGGPALVANMWWLKMPTNRKTYRVSKNGGMACDVYYYKKGKVQRLGEAFASGYYRLVYLKNYGLIGKGDTVGTSTPWRFYIKNGKLYNKRTSPGKYKWKDHLLLVKKNK